MKCNSFITVKYWQHKSQIGREYRQLNMLIKKYVRWVDKNCNNEVLTKTEKREAYKLNKYFKKKNQKGKKQVGHTLIKSSWISLFNNGGNCRG